eukprot:1144460-Pelagomonas_calceolata.AAC.3
MDTNPVGKHASFACADAVRLALTAMFNSIVWMRPGGTRMILLQHPSPHICDGCNGMSVQWRQ